MRPAECAVVSCATQLGSPPLLLHVPWRHRCYAALCHAGWQPLTAEPEPAWLWQSQATAARRRPVQMLLQMLQRKGCSQLLLEIEVSWMGCPQ